jgi:hypothetical protein
LLLREKAYFEHGLRLGSGNTVDIHKDEHNRWDNIKLELEKNKKIYSSDGVELFYII